MTFPYGPTSNPSLYQLHLFCAERRRPGHARGMLPTSSIEGIEERFTIEATPSPQGVVHMAMNRRL